jgi:hypothetical protein
MRFRPSPATVIALIALFVALDGPATAAKLISGSSIRKNTITSRQVKAGSLSRTDLKSGSIRFLQKTAPRSIGSTELASGAISGDKLAPASVGPLAIADKTLTATEIAPGSLTAGVLGADSVGFTEMADDSVGKANIRAAAVGQSEIGDNGVGTEEVIDGKLKMGDLGSFAGVASATFESIAAGECQAEDVQVAPIANATQPDLSKTFVLVGQAATWPGDTVTLSARPLDATTLHLSACNLSAAAVEPGVQLVPYVALVP